jgi:hypothetical protein
MKKQKFWNIFNFDNVAMFMIILFLLLSPIVGLVCYSLEKSMKETEQQYKYIITYDNAVVLTNDYPVIDNNGCVHVSGIRYYIIKNKYDNDTYRNDSKPFCGTICGDYVIDENKNEN